MGFLSKLFRMDVAPDAARLTPTTNDPAYTTAGFGRRSMRWRPPLLGPNAALDGSAETLRAQSRDMTRKNVIAAAAVDRITSNVVGVGIKPQIPDEAVQALWAKWTDESAPDGMLDFYGQQVQIMRAIVDSGECFVRLRPRRITDGLSVPLQIEVLESEFVPMHKNEMLGNGGVIRQGIEFDPAIKSRRTGYWMRKQHPADATPGVLNDEFFFVPATEVCHLFLPTRPGQVRGEPWMARCLDRLKDVESYDKAELVRKKTAAMLVGFIRRTLPEGVSAEDLAEVWGDDATITDGLGDVSLEPGTMQFLQPGEDVEFAAPSDVGGMYEVFMRSQHRSIAASLGVLYEQLTGDYSQVNDRTWRAAVNEFRRRVEQWQYHLIVFQLCRPIYRRWIDLAMLSGAAPQGSDALAVKWTPPAWPYINPVQDVQSKVAEIKAGLTSRSAVCSRDGEDAEVIDRENAADNKRADSLDLFYDTTTKTPPDPTPNMKSGGFGDPLKQPTPEPSQKSKGF